jgi:hypothetical protein
MKYSGGESPYIGVDVCVRRRRERAIGGNNKICPRRSRNKSLTGPDRLSHSNDIEVGSEELGVDERLVERVSGV